MKILIIANNQKWRSWDKKIQELKDWFAPAVSLDIDLKHETFSDIPVEPYGVFDGQERKGISKAWFHKNLTSKYPQYDIVILSMPRKEWKCLPVEGWQWGGNSIAIGSNERGSYNFKGVNYEGDKWFNIARHEVCHALYVKQGKVDNTHKYWDTGILGQVLVELKQSKIVNMVTNIVMPPKGYRYFNYSEIVGLKPELVRMLDDTRHMAGIPFKITSGFRTPEHNKKIGGSPNSAHLRGLAVDIACPTNEARHKIITSAIACGFTRIGIGKTYVHLDCDPSLPQNVIWHYY